MSMLNYFFIGIAFICFIDILLTFKYIKKQIDIKNLEWSMKERIICILIWPLSVLVFLNAFFKAYFKK